MEKGTFTDPRDGKTYKTVKIGKQTWLAENLNYDADGSKCYNNDPANADKYGRLYNWETAKKACPDGWHLPSNEEWQELVNFAGGDRIAGKKLKATSGWNDYCGQPDCSTDEYGFAALPGGSVLNGDFRDIGINGDWWSASERNLGRAYKWNMGYVSDLVLYDDFTKSNLFSVRCVKD